MLHQQSIAGMRSTAAGNHENGRYSCSLWRGDDAGVILLAIEAKDDKQLSFRFGAGDHVPARRRAAPPSTGRFDAQGRLTHPVRQIISPPWELIERLILARAAPPPRAFYQPPLPHTANRRPEVDRTGCRRADAAAVRAIASGSQHSTIKAISHRIARSLSVSAPMSSATYRIPGILRGIQRRAARQPAGHGFYLEADPRHRPQIGPLTDVNLTCGVLDRRVS